MATKDNTIVVATKNGRTRKFTQFGWDLLGNNKNGWVQVTDQMVVNSATQKPGTGQTQPVTKNTTEVKNLGRNVIEIFEEHIQKGVDFLAVKDFTNALTEAQAALKYSPKSVTAINLNEAIITAMNAEPAAESPLATNSNTSNTENTSGLSEEEKKEWIKNNLSMFNKTGIKDYFDGIDKQYPSKADLPTLQMLLAEHFEFNEEKLKEAI